MNASNIERIAIHEDKHSEKVVKFIDATVSSLSEYCSVRYARRILRAQEMGRLWGVYFTQSGNIRATFF